MEHSINKISFNKDDFICYQQINPLKPNPIIFFGGFNSDMMGTKACALFDYCYSNNLNFTRFDYYGHGKSTGDFKDGTITIWLENCLNIIDLLKEPAIIIGSSMGGWLMLLATLKRLNKVKSLIGIASAPDFTEKLMWQSMDEQQKAMLLSDVPVEVKGFQVNKKLILDGRKHLISDHEINIEVPITLIHGMQDLDVPYSFSINLAEKLKSRLVKTILVKNSDHRMNGLCDLKLLLDSLAEHLK